jgi:hypothetical protein
MRETYQLCERYRNIYAGCGSLINITACFMSLHVLRTLSVVWGGFICEIFEWLPVIPILCD